MEAWQLVWVSAAIALLTAGAGVGAMCPTQVAIIASLLGLPLCASGFLLLFVLGAPMLLVFGAGIFLGAFGIGRLLALWRNPELQG